MFKGYYPVFLDYPFVPRPRYGHGKPPHAQLYAQFAALKPEITKLLSEFLKFEDGMRRIPLRKTKHTADPSWINKWFAGLDVFALYGFIASSKPKLYLEIGSGFSTKLARQAIQEEQLRTRILSVDPRPRAEINPLCDELFRRPLEDVDLALFKRLNAGDILFFDGSHRAFMNSDVTVFFLDILPNLSPGIFVHIHDIELPYDYPAERAHWYYSEQYLLAVALLEGHKNFRVLLPNAFVSQEPDCLEALNPLWNAPGLKGVPKTGNSFWLQTV
ncbi:MAG: class I SAM-dependent methyltransferase [Acidobacteria bacterium]|nr:class I SAM-dependent methyltransferase [Acidobacteriota bacterium]MBV9145738.1 class I SAM-dependent methyltransferase [Acidobacteriota bacterium]MBV9434497.1 class I SAM-dependent methyltransferase [Acidobacteriota bacterium]